MGDRSLQATSLVPKPLAKSQVKPALPPHLPKGGDLPIIMLLMISIEKVSLDIASMHVYNVCTGWSSRPFTFLYLGAGEGKGLA